MPLLLTLDRGNTTLDVLLRPWPDAGAAGAGPAPLLQAPPSLPPPLRRARLATVDELEAFLAADVPRVQAAIGASVVPDGLRAVADLLAARGIGLSVCGRDVACPLPIAYETRATLGVDRVLGALAAHRRFGRAVVVDCGSATTVNLVEADGTFSGGAIAPGFRALLAGMAQVTPHLPTVDAALPFAMPPRTSASAVAAGAALAFCGGIERLVADTLRAARGPATVVLTGGHAEDYLRHGRLAPEHVPDLVHEGLAWTALATRGAAVPAANPPCAS